MYYGDLDVKAQGLGQVGPLKHKRQKKKIIELYYWASYIIKNLTFTLLLNCYFKKFRLSATVGALIGRLCNTVYLFIYPLNNWIAKF